MAKNDSKIKGLKTAATGGAIDGSKLGGRKPRAESGPVKVSRKGEGYVSDDGAGTRSKAGLPPETVAMRAPEAKLPKVAADIASPTAPIPSCDDGPINAIWGWEVARDRKLGKMGNS